MGDATCFEDGNQIRYCTNPYCREFQTQLAVGSKLSHELQEVKATTSSCYKEGFAYDHYQCIHCENRFSANDVNSMITDQTVLDQLLLPKAPHVYEDFYTNDIPSSGNKHGWESRHCINYEHCKMTTDGRPSKSETEDETIFPPDAQA